MSSTALPEDRPTFAPPAPPAPPALRRTLAQAYLHGSGIEIGALHLRMWLPGGTAIRYVDRMTVTDLRLHYPEVATQDLAPVDVVDDGERLHAIAPQSVDFIVANHFLEHCQDPISTIATHLAKLRPGGVLFYAVPDRRFTFDFRRPSTPLAHVIEDHERGPEHSRDQHYLEWVSLVVGPPEGVGAGAHARRLQADDYSIHFHVWTQSDLLELILHVQQRAGGFEIETMRRNGIENIMVLRKNGDLSPRTPGATATQGITVPEKATLAPAPSVGQTRDRIPLGALRARRWPDTDAIHWSVDPEGLTGLGLVQPVTTVYTVPLILQRPVRLQARARLLPREWKYGAHAVRAVLVALQVNGERRELWSAAVRSRRSGGDESGVLVDCEIPATSTELILVVEPSSVRGSNSVSLVAWMAASICDPEAAPDPARSEPTADAVMNAEGPSASGPRFSVLTPVHDPPIEMLREAIESVRAQSYESWELCLVDDGSLDPLVTETLRHYADIDDRIHLTTRRRSGGISDATNAALAQAGGDYIALLDHDDLLAPNALELVAGELVRDPSLDMIYSDEAVHADGRRLAQMLKPGWAPESFTCHMYTCHLGVYRRTRALELGGFRSQFDGCQDYDFVLRLMELTDRIAHVPAQLYLWRAHTASTAEGGEAKPYAYLAQPRAIAEHLDRLGVDASVQFGALPGMHRIVHRTDPSVAVSVVLASPGTEEVLAVARSLAEQPHRSWRLVIGVAGPSRHQLASALNEAAVDPDWVTLVNAEGPRATVLTQAAAAARGEHVLLLDSPAVGLTAEWVTALLGYSAQSGIGAAGPLVLGPEGRVMECGYSFPQGIALPFADGVDGAHINSVAMNVTAVGGALMTPRGTLDEVGGLDADYGELMLVEYCLRVGELGARVVQVPDSRLALTSPDRRSNDLGGLWRLRRRFIARHTHDALYNPNFRVDRGELSPQVHF